ASAGRFGRGFRRRLGSRRRTGQRDRAREAVAIEKDGWVLIGASVFADPHGRGSGERQLNRPEEAFTELARRRRVLGAGAVARRGAWLWPGACSARCSRGVGGPLRRDEGQRGRAFWPERFVLVRFRRFASDQRADREKEPYPTA